MCIYLRIPQRGIFRYVHLVLRYSFTVVTYTNAQTIRYIQVSTYSIILIIMTLMMMMMRMMMMMMMMMMRMRMMMMIIIIQITC